MGPTISPTPSFCCFLVSDSILCQSRFRHSHLRSKRKPIPASVPAPFKGNLRTSCSQFLLQSYAQRQAPTKYQQVHLWGRVCLKPRWDSEEWWRREQTRGEGRRAQRKVDKQWEGVAWSRHSAVADCPVNGSIYRYTPHFVVYTLHTCTLTKDTKPLALRSSIYPLKLSWDSGGNEVFHLSALKTLLLRGSVSKLWWITGHYIMCLCLKGSKDTHGTPVHLK